MYVDVDHYVLCSCAAFVHFLCVYLCLGVVYVNVYVFVYVSVSCL